MHFAAPSAVSHRLGAVDYSRRRGYICGMSLSAGTRLGAFEIIASIGARGMGEIDKARDTRLDRIVPLCLDSCRMSDAAVKSIQM